MKQACDILECDIEEFKNARRISRDNKLKLDNIISLLWKTGAYTNKKIGTHVGLGCSAVSRCVSNCNELCNTSKAFKQKYNAVKSLITNQDVTPMTNGWVGDPYDSMITSC